MFNTFSLPGFQCIDGLLLPEHLQLSVGRNSDSILPELFPTMEQYIPISLLLFLKLDYQSLFIDISLPWSDDNTSCRRLYQLGDLLPADILNAHYDLFSPYKSVLFLTIYIFDWLYYTTDCAIEQVFFSFFRNSSPTCRGRRILAIFMLNLHTSKCRYALNKFASYSSLYCETSLFSR